MNVRNHFQITMRLVLALAVAAGILFLAVGPAYAQSPVYAEVDRTSLSVGETLTLSVVVNSAYAGTPEVPNLDGFQILSSSKSSQFSMINGQVSAQGITHFILAPTRTGALTIPPIPVEVDGQTYTTEPITIDVATGGAPSQPGQPVQPVQPVTPPGFPSNVGPGSSLWSDLDALLGGMGAESGSSFVEAEVDNPSPYVGEQVIYTFRYYREIANSFGQPSYEAPSFSGFWSESETQQRDYDVQAGNRLYRVVEVQHVLFPTSAGEHTIDPAVLSVQGGFFRP